MIHPLLSEIYSLFLNQAAHHLAIFGGYLHNVDTTLQVSHL